MRGKIPAWLFFAAFGAVALYFRKPAGEALTMATNYQNSRTNEEKYRPIIADVERRYGIPAGILHRLIKTESSFRDDVIKGLKPSPVGARGIAQFMPATARELNVNPLDPVASIDAAGRYLKTIMGWTGNKSWTHAVAAYNWGAGSVNNAVKKYGTNWLAYAPTETKNYVTKVVA